MPGGTPKGSSWKINDPNNGKGFESAVAYAVAKQLGFSTQPGQVDVRPVQQSFAPGPKSFDFDINQISFTPARAKVVTFSASYYDVNQAIVVLKGTKIATVPHDRGPARRSSSARSSGRRATTTSTTRSSRRRSRPSSRRTPAAVQALKNEQIDGLVVDLPTAFYVTAVQVPNCDDPRPVPDRGAAVSTSAWCFAKGNPLAALRRQGARVAEGERHAEADPAAVASEGDRRAGPEVAAARLEAFSAGCAPAATAAGASRSRSRAPSSSSPSLVRRRHALARLARGAAARSSTGASSASSFPEIARAFMLNVKIFSIAEVFILVVRARARGDPQPAGAGLLPAARARDRLRRLLPRRADDPRDRDPRLRRAGAAAQATSRPRRSSGGSSRSSSSTRRTSPRSTGPGSSRCTRRQEAAARSLGLSPRAGAAVRDPAAGGAARDPAAPERLHRAAEGHGARRRSLGAIEAFNQSQIDADATFNYTPYLAAALLFVAITIPLARFTDWLIAARPPPPAGGGASGERPALVARGRAQVVRPRTRCCAGSTSTVAEHEVVCLIGASGSGKSTLLRCVNLIEPIDAGRIVVAGDEITAPRRRREPRPAPDRDRLPGVQPLPAHERAAQRDARRRATVLGLLAREAEARAIELLGASGSPTSATTIPDRLSGGQQQRVAIVRALAMQPELMLLDEVTSALDPELVAEVLEVIRELAAGGMTMLIATHEMALRARHRRPRLLPRRAASSSSRARPSEIFSAPREPRTQQFLQRIIEAKRL